MSRNPVDHSVLDSIANRWSPYRFEPREVEDGKLVQCLEAARWAASSFNEQPWQWIVARRQDDDQFQKMIDCLMEANQGWAKNAGVLILTAIRTKFAYNDKPNRVALHDLGLAAANLSLQATDLGLQIHQMAGVNLSRVRLEYGVPDDYEPQTAIAIGYPDMSAPSGEQAEQLAKRDNSQRTRRPLREQVFGGKWGDSAAFLS
ncbi:MAG: nitroreductase family protein [Pirellulaceae bacterium]|nr:nitroreductase family protein [Pirellulaceae bacterium]